MRLVLSAVALLLRMQPGADTTVDKEVPTGSVPSRSTAADGAPSGQRSLFVVAQ